MRGKILLTGATGFLGGEMLKRLLREDRRRVVCLVRADSVGAAQQRGQDTLQRLFGPELAEMAKPRVQWQPGDVSEARLGLSGAGFRALAVDVQEIFHCAASTQFDLTLEDAQRINVQGVKNVYRLAELATCNRRFRRLHHVSTAYAAGRRRGTVQADFLPTDETQNFRNTYEQTKAQAERFLRARMDLVPTTIYRPSIVVGDSQTGWTNNWNVVYFPMRLMAMGRLPFASKGGRSLLDCVPVDYVADSILALARREDTLGQGFHVTASEDALTVQDVIRHTYAGLARRQGSDMKVATRALGPLAWWCLTTYKKLTGSDHVRKALKGFSVYADYTRVNMTFDGARVETLLRQEGVVRPQATEFFSRCVDFALRENFGRPRRSVRGRKQVPASLAEVFRTASGRLAEALQSGTGSLATN